MRLLFADAFYWVALLHRRDSAHDRAIALSRTITDATLVTTDEVLTEVLALASSSGMMGRSVAVSTIRDILRDPGIDVVPQTREGFMRGRALCEQRLDNGYSLTDCISMDTMRRLDVDTAITNDRHFVQEGFHILLGEEA